MLSTVRIGMVGAGAVAARHLRTLLAMDGVEVVAVADPALERAKELAAEAGAAVYPNHMELLEAERLDAVYICVPPFAHGAPELAVIDAGLPMFVEKPVAIDQETAAAIAARLAGRSLVTCTGYHWRWLDIFDRAASSSAGGWTRSPRPPGGCAATGRAARRSSRPPTSSTPPGAWPATWPKPTPSERERPRRTTSTTCPWPACGSRRGRWGRWRPPACCRGCTGPGCRWSRTDCRWSCPRPSWWSRWTAGATAGRRTATPGPGPTGTSSPRSGGARTGSGCPGPRPTGPTCWPAPSPARRTRAGRFLWRPPMADRRPVRLLVIERPGVARLVDEDEPAPAGGQFRLETLYTGLSAGTELTYFKGTNPYLHAAWDERLGVFRRDRPATGFPVRAPGYMEVGRVSETSSDAVAVGDLVAMAYGHKTAHTADPAVDRFVVLPQDLDPVLGIHVAHMGPICANGLLHAAADAAGPGAIQLGDGVSGRHVLVTGAGVVGLLVALFARHHGAAEVVVADATPARLAVARALGLDAVDDADGTAWRAVKERWRRDPTDCGADVVFQCRGRTAALAGALRSL